MNDKFVAYYRVSTNSQGISGLGMDAQKTAVQNFLNSGTYELIGEFAEVESGKRKQRPELDQAIELCRHTKAKLLIAKLDRLARNTYFLLGLRDSGVDFVCCDMPYANKLTITILAAVAEQERDWISQRTIDGLAEAKRRGTRLGNPRLNEARHLAIAANQRKAADFAIKTSPIIQDIRKAKITSLQGIADCLNRRGYQTPNGKQFFPQSVKNLLSLCHETA